VQSPRIEIRDRKDPTSGKRAVLGGQVKGWIEEVPVIRKGLPIDLGESEIEDGLSSPSLCRCKLPITFI
jgi:hypothetical protein